MARHQAMPLSRTYLNYPLTLSNVCMTFLGPAKLSVFIVRVVLDGKRTAV